MQRFVEIETGRVDIRQTGLKVVQLFCCRSDSPPCFRKSGREGRQEWGQVQDGNVGDASIGADREKMVRGSVRTGASLKAGEDSVRL